MQILIAEDDCISRKALYKMLTKWDYTPVVAEDGAQAWEVLQNSDSPQLVILDWMMPEIDGLEICRKVRDCFPTAIEINDCIEKNKIFSNPSQRYIYIILLTARSDQEDVIKGLQAGADDYIVKPFNPDELKARIRAGKRIVELHNQLLSIQNYCINMAKIDYLTHINNRRAIIESLSQEFSRAKRDKYCLSLVMIDIDYFKNINDKYGHAIGDLVLLECVKRIQSSLRDYDILGRFGGEEFLLIVPKANFEQASKICERIRSLVGKDPMRIQGKSILISISLGFTIWDWKSSMDEAIKAADDALYRAKRLGRNRVEYENL